MLTMIIPSLAAFGRCVARGGLQAARQLGQRALLHPDPRAQLARDARRSCSTSRLWQSGATVEPGFIHQPVFNIDVLVALLRQENAKDLCVIKLPKELKYTDYFIIVSGTSTRHLQAMAQYAIKAYKHLKRQQNIHVHIEGKDTDDWKCIDFGNIVVHFMLSETREVYELEKLWTLHSYDDQFNMIPPETLPRDFIYGPTDIDENSDFRRLS
ncbi:mitochondrial assembly of ribosomal large subunit protein 1 [Stegostoma tigrinum]|uniref:mitochondrial assembly of ribosomal large subunit protein 1 n=1 Tax=Stegostoma tigrinum TaxID=3053191 RepID=UPI00202AF1D5|nr:mitochondrial assembly of ribosomal large subunit protein 1 [Stegostoma tigrinum]